MQVSDRIRTDVLIIGAGAAGIRAALAAAEEGAQVTIVSKGPATRCGSSFSSVSGGWGIQALMGKERTERKLEGFYDDIIQAGMGMADPRLVRILVEESGPRLEDLLSYGLRLRKDPQGEYLRVKGCFSDSERAFLTGDMENIRRCFLSMLERSGAGIVTGHVMDLVNVKTHGACRGAWILAEDKSLLRVSAGATVLATGGGAGIFQDHMVTDDDVGEGYALAYKAGAEFKNLEFIQFMLGIKGPGIRRFFPLSALGKPGLLIDSDGQDLLQRAIPDQGDRLRACAERMKHHPFSTRDPSFLIDTAAALARNEGRRIFLNSGDQATRGMEVVHFSHAFNGGIRIDETGQSMVPGLFAAGEVAAGPHGADRIGGSMMTATQVFGARAGKFAARRALGMAAFLARGSLSEPPQEPSRRPGIWNRSKGSLNEIERELRRICSTHLMLLRHEDGLNACISGAKQALSLVECATDGTLQGIKLRNAFTTACLVAESALRRKENLGPHCRRGFPPVSCHETQRADMIRRLPLRDTALPIPGAA
ncbi:MAG: FAD-binding protein [Deltaproteobacteria bacterium]|nr:FAD-binding protein [Deltaproteobacteria bacterium]